MIPRYKLIAAGKDITDNFKGRLVNLVFKDERGIKSDSLNITLDDTDAAIALPRRGVVLELILGIENNMYHCGRFTVDELTHSGPADQLTIRAKATDTINSKLKTEHSESYKQKTLGQILEKVASRHGLTLKCSDQLKSISIKHVDQQDESDLHFITRLAKKYGAVAKTSDNTLLFVERGKATSASGKAMPTVKINRKQSSDHSFSIKGRGEYTGVIAHYFDNQKSKRIKVTVGTRDKAKTLKGNFATKEEAEAAANAAYSNLKRDSSSGDINLKQGIPSLRAESKVDLTGFRDFIDGTWLITTATHTLSGSGGLSSRITLEKPDN